MHSVVTQEHTCPKITDDFIYIWNLSKHNQIKLKQCKRKTNKYIKQWKGSNKNSVWDSQVK